MVSYHLLVLLTMLQNFWSCHLGLLRVMSSLFLNFWPYHKALCSVNVGFGDIALQGSDLAIEVQNCLSLRGVFDWRINCCCLLIILFFFLNSVNFCKKNFNFFVLDLAAANLELTKYFWMRNLEVEVLFWLIIKDSY